MRPPNPPVFLAVIFRPPSLWLAAVLLGGVFFQADGASPEVNPVRPSVRLDLDSANVVMAGEFAPGRDLQAVKLDRPAIGRYFCLETLSAYDGRPYAAVAKLYLLDATGHRIERTKWKVAYVDSEELDRENGAANHVIDDDPNSYWHTQWSLASPNHPHHLILDLGEHETVTGFQYLPRAGKGDVGGRIKDYRVYVGDNLLDVSQPEPNLPREYYLMSYFTGEGEDGLHLAYSLNGYRWTPLNQGQPVLPPTAGDRLMRDPCLLHAPDGTFRLVWTAAWTGNYIGYATSKDLVHWSAQQAIPLMAKEPTTLNCWAPEVYWDAVQQDYVVYWASTVTARTGWTTVPDNNRIYAATTKDFITFSPTRQLFNPGFGVLDATMVAVHHRVALIFKDETISHLRVAMADTPSGPFQLGGLTFENDYAEGPTAFHLGDETAVFFHAMTGNRCGAVKTADWQHWSDISSGVVFPPGCKQSTVLTLPGETLRPLQQAGYLEIGTTVQASELGVGDWIWTTNLTDRQSCRLWRSFDVPADTPVVRADLRMTADNSYTAYLDGQEIGRGGDAHSLAEYDLTWFMTPGHHVLAVEAFNDTMDAGVIAGLRLKLANGRKLEVLSGSTWRIAPDNVRNWRTQKTADDGWLAASVVGYAGQAWWQYPDQIIQVPPLAPPVVHFWQQAWVLVTLLLACLTVAILWLRMGLQLALQTRAQRLLERERARIARDMHDDLGSGLTQLTLLGELVLREDACGGEAQVRLNKLCAKARQLLRSMDEIVWAVNPQRDTVKDFSAFIADHAQEYLATTAIRCRQEVAAELPDLPLDLPQRRNLMLAVKEAIRNAARHSGASEVTLSVSVASNALRVMVEDNGQGLPAVAQSGRNGMTNMRQRLADIGGDFTCTSAPGQGCRVTFSLPLLARERLNSNHS